MSSILKVKNKTTPQSIRIETNILEPQSISQSHATFLFKNTGVMDKNTTVIMPILCDDVDNHLYLTAGAFGLVETATLKYAGNTIAQTDNVGGFQSVRQLLHPQEKRNLVNAVNTGAPYCWAASQDWKNKADGLDLGGILLPPQIDDLIRQEDGRLTLKADVWNRNETPLSTFPQFIPTVAQPLPEDGDVGLGKHKRYLLGTDRATTFIASITLEDLFPELMKDIQIPLFLLNEQLSLELIFTPVRERGFPDFANAGNPSPKRDITIDTHGTHIVQDLLYYDDNTQDRIRAENNSPNGISITYGDLVNVRTTLVNPNQTLVAAAGEERSVVGDYTVDVGLDNMTLRYIVMSLGDEEGLDNPINPARSNYMLGKYNSLAPQLEDNGLEMNLIINNSPVYPENVGSFARQYNGLQQVFGGVPLQVPKGCYTWEASVLDKYAISQLVNGSTTAPQPVPSVGDLWWVDAEERQGGNCLLALYDNSANGNFKGLPITALTGGSRYLGVNLTTTYANVRGAGTKIGNSSVRIRIRNKFTAISNELYQEQSLTNRVMNIWSCVERTMMIKGGDIFVSEN